MANEHTSDDGGTRSLPKDVDANSFPSLPEPEPLKNALMLDFWDQAETIELLCTACSVRTLPCPDTRTDVDWVHCKMFPRKFLHPDKTMTTRTLLIPCDYVTRACPSSPSIFRVSHVDDVKYMPAGQQVPANPLPLFEIHRALTACRGLSFAEPETGRAYNDLVGNMSKEFENALSGMRAIHNFDYGDEFEVALCKTFRRILPQRFGICRGFVVNSRGDTAGDDIIIFDRMRFPTIRSLDAEDYARKEQVPIEAVYAYIEAKHSLSIQDHAESSLARAIQQVSRVKLLCIQRWRVPLTHILPNVAVTNEASIELLPDWPDIRNPIFGAVIARQMRLRQRDPVLKNADTIEQAILRSTHTCALPPDIIIAGATNLLIPALPSDRPNASRSPSPFFLYGRSHMNPVTVDGVAFGAGLSFLLWALDWIQLGEMPWPGILRNAMPPKSAKAESNPDTVQ